MPVAVAMERQSDTDELLLDANGTKEYPITPVVVKRLPYVTPPTCRAANCQSGSMMKLGDDPEKILVRRKEVLAVITRGGVGVLLAAAVAVGAMLAMG